MVKSTLFIFTCLMLGCSAINHMNQTPTQIDFESITIKHNGAYSDYISSDETAESCKTFILDQAEIINFFSQSRTATPREYEHDLTASSCYASGSFVSSSDEQGTWKIDRARRGMITISDNTKYYCCFECKNPQLYEP